MTRRMSCSMTTDAVRDRSKTVTRRATRTWQNLEVGDHLTLVEKAMGLKKGERQVILADVEIIDIRLEPITAIWDEPGGVEREGITDMSPNLFAYWWAEHHGHPGVLTPEQLRGVWCRRIEWRYLT